MPISGNRLNIRSGHTHVQDVAASVWTVIHNLGREVISDVTIDIDGISHKILPYDVVNIDNNTLEITFTSPRTGKVRVA